jgi:hypothetical protein
MSVVYTFTRPTASRGLLDFDAVRQAVPLPVFLESLGIELQQEGDACRCRCPLHNEQHGASFIVYPDQHWFCHGKCAATYPKGGDVIDLASALWDDSDRHVVVERLLGGEAPTAATARTARQAASRPSSEPKWPARNLEQLDTIVRSGLGLYDLWEESYIRLEDGNHAEHIIDTVFPGNPLLCIGQQEWRFATKPREDWRGELSRYPLIVPNPMLADSGLTQAGKPSQHTLQATAARVYLPIEFDCRKHTNDGRPTEFLPLVEAWERDGITSVDACCALHGYLKDRLPLVIGVHTGGIGVHGWYAAFDRDEDTELWPFMRHAYSLGADRVTWTRSQFVRLPDGRRQNGTRQVTYYFDPFKAVTL